MNISGDETFVLVASIVVAIAATAKNRITRLPSLSLKDNPGPGLVRLAILASIGWIIYVLAYYADPSVTGIYNYFYLIMGFAVIQFFGAIGLRMFGVHPRIDVGERKNWAAAIFAAGFFLGTGLIFGGSLWGEADPTDASGEGGWWIPLGFFLLGWLVMVTGLILYFVRERGTFRKRIRQERDSSAAMAAASFTISAAILMASAVSGDFWGWGEGLKDVGLAAGLLLVHEFIRMPEKLAQRQPVLRGIESAAYFGIVAINIVVQWLR